MGEVAAVVSEAANVAGFDEFWQAALGLCAGGG